MQSVALHIVAFVVFLRDLRAVGCRLISADLGPELQPECEQFLHVLFVQ